MQHSKKKILICDDQYDFYETLRFIINEYLDDNLVDVDFSENGLDALLNTSKTKYDLIISDFKMPGINGVEFVNTLRSRESSKNKKTPILMFSAYRPNLSELEAGEGSVDFMSKPFKSEELMEYIKNNI